MNIKEIHKIKTTLIKYLILFIYILIIGCAGVKNSWEKAETTGTIESYEEFKKQYPSSKLNDEVNRRLEILYFKKSVKENNIKLYEEFLEKYPNSELTDEIDTRLEKLLFKDCKIKNSILSYSEFLIRYSKGNYTEIAKKNLMKLKYEDALIKDSINIYQKFLDEYPESEFTDNVYQKQLKLYYYIINKCRTARIIVKQSYFNDELDNLSLPFYSLSANLLNKYAGLDILNQDTENCDIILRINSRGKALRGEYKEVGGNDIGWLYLGASLEGTILFEIPGILSYKKSFKNIIEPPPLTSSLLHPDYIKDSPTDAPIETAFYMSDDNSFIYSILELIGLLFNTDSLFSAINDSRTYVWENTAEVIGDIDISSTEYLISLLKDERVDVRLNSVLAIGNNMCKDAVIPLITTLSDKSPNIRRNSARVLGKLDDIRAVEPLIKAFSDDDFDVRLEAIIALGRLKDSRAIEPLNRALVDSLEMNKVKNDIFNQQYIMNIFSNDFKGISDLQKFIMSVAYTLGELGDSSSINPLINSYLFYPGHINSHLENEIIISLSKIFKYSPYRIRIYLNSDNVKLRRLAVIMLLVESNDIFFYDPDKHITLLTALKDNDDMVRIYAACALANYNDYSAVKHLISAFNLSRYSFDDYLEKYSSKYINEDDKAKQYLGLYIRRELNNDELRQNRLIGSAELSLLKLTRDNFYRDYEKWQAWYEKNKQYFE